MDLWNIVPIFAIHFKKQIKMAKETTTRRGGFKAGSKKALLAGARSLRTRRYNQLQAEYDAATSAGQKSAIKKRMNALPTV